MQKVFVVANGRRIGPMSQRWAETIFLPLLEGARVVPVESGESVAGIMCQWRRIGLMAIDAVVLRNRYTDI
jgi:hypothetical protein